MPVHENIPLKRIFHTWWPLAASWLLMSAELPALSAVIARLANPEINLAAYGGVVFPIALIIESPIIMLLAASTALSKDWASFAKLRRFMTLAGASLTALHALVAFTPLYDIVIVGLLHPPPEIIEPARIGLRFMLPWTWSIAYRRFHQGVLIRFNHSRLIGAGTIIRLSADMIVLMIGYAIGTIPGVIVATTAVSAGVISEAVYVGIVTRPVLRTDLRQAPPAETPLTLRIFLNFYIPLLMTSLLTMLIQPMGSAALGRMPHPLESLATWPVAWGLVNLIKNTGTAFNEVVVALLDRPGSTRNLQRFCLIMAAATTGLIILVAATPLSRFWFLEVSALNPQLADLAQAVLWLGLPMPALTFYQSWFQGAILHGRHTRHVTESVVIFLALSAVLLTLGVIWGKLPGLYVAIGTFVTCTTVQVTWLWWRSREVIAEAKERDNLALEALVEQSAAD